MVLVATGIAAVIVVILVAVIMSIRLGRRDSDLDDMGGRGDRDLDLRGSRNPAASRRGGGRPAGYDDGPRPYRGRGEWPADRDRSGPRDRGEPGYPARRPGHDETRAAAAARRGPRGSQPESRRPGRYPPPDDTGPGEALYDSSADLYDAPPAGDGFGRGGNRRRRAPGDSGPGEVYRGGHGDPGVAREVRAHDDDFPSEQLPAAPADRPEPGPRRGPGGQPTARSRQQRGKRDDEEWSSADWDKLTDEQYWKTLSASRPQELEPEPEPPSVTARGAGSENGSAGVRPGAGQGSSRPVRPASPEPGRYAGPDRRSGADRRGAAAERQPGATERRTGADRRLVTGDRRPGATAGDRRPGATAGDRRPGAAAGDRRSGAAPGDRRPGPAAGDRRSGAAPGPGADRRPAVQRNDARDTGPGPERRRDAVTERLPLRRSQPALPPVPVAADDATSVLRNGAGAAGRAADTGPGRATGRAGLSRRHQDAPGSSWRSDDDPLTSPSYSRRSGSSSDSRSYRGTRIGPGGGSDRNGSDRDIGRSDRDIGRSDRSGSDRSGRRGGRSSSDRNNSGSLGRSTGSGESLGLSTGGSQGRADAYPLPAAADHYQRTSPGPAGQSRYPLPPIPVPPADPLTRDPYGYPAADHGYQPATGPGYYNGNQNGNGHGDSGQPWNAAQYAPSYQPGSSSYQPGSSSYQPGSSSYQPGSYQPPAGGQAPPPDGSGPGDGWYPLPPATNPAPASPVPGSMPAAPAPGGAPGSAPDAAQYPYPPPGPGYPAAGYGGDQAASGYPEAYEDYQNGYANGYGGYVPDPYPPDGYTGYRPQG